MKCRLSEKVGLLKVLRDTKDTSPYKLNKLMGFDLNGLNAKNKKGEYFRNNCWWWRPLWKYVSELGILTDEQINSGSFNDGKEIPEETAKEISKKLKLLIRTGEVKKYEKAYKKEQKELLDETCEYCKGTGKRNDKFVKGKCNVCKGKGKVRPTSTWYSFSEENIKEFANFCANSGGFTIC